VKVEHGELLEAYIANIAHHEGISKSQVGNEREVQPTKNRPKVALGQNSLVIPLLTRDMKNVKTIFNKI